MEPFWKTSPAVVLVLLLFGLFIPMGWGAPQGSAVVMRNSVAIVPDVAGEVVEVPVAANTPIKAGDVLFRIDPVPYRGAGRCARRAAQARGDAARRDEPARPRQRRPRLRRRAAAGRRSTSSRRRSSARNGISTRPWCVRRPTATSPTSRCARVRGSPPCRSSPVMAFIDTSETIVGVEIDQIDTRYIAPGQPVEVTFKFLPGEVYTGKVVAVLQAISTGQVQTSGSAVTPRAAAGGALRRAREARRRRRRRQPAGRCAGDAAIFTEHVKAAHIIRKVLLRQIAILNYVVPF